MDTASATRQSFYGKAQGPKTYVERVWGGPFNAVGCVDHVAHQGFDPNLLVSRSHASTI